MKPLTFWVVYYSPQDFPGRYVVRGHDMVESKLKPHDLARSAATLEEVRALVPKGLYRFDRHAFDEPAIVEIWV